MRLNINIIAPWLHGKPIKTWLFHYYYIPTGCIQCKGDYGVQLIGVNFQLTFDSRWNGISFAINL